MMKKLLVLFACLALFAAPAMAQVSWMSIDGETTSITVTKGDTFTVVIWAAAPTLIHTVIHSIQGDRDYVVPIDATVGDDIPGSWITLYNINLEWLPEPWLFAGLSYQYGTCDPLTTGANQVYTVDFIATTVNDERDGTPLTFSENCSGQGPTDLLVEISHCVVTSECGGKYGVTVFIVDPEKPSYGPVEPVVAMPNTRYLGAGAYSNHGIFLPKSTNVPPRLTAVEAKVWGAVKDLYRE